MKGCSRRSSDTTPPTQCSRYDSLNEGLLPKEQRRVRRRLFRMVQQASMKGCSRRSSDRETHIDKALLNCRLNEGLLPKEQRQNLQGVARELALASMKGCSRRSSDHYGQNVDGGGLLPQ